MRLVETDVAPTSGTKVIGSRAAVLLLLLIAFIVRLSVSDGAQTHTRGRSSVRPDACESVIGLGERASQFRKLGELVGAQIELAGQWNRRIATDCDGFQRISARFSAFQRLFKALEGSRKALESLWKALSSLARCRPKVSARAARFRWLGK